MKVTAFCSNPETGTGMVTNSSLFNAAVPLKRETDSDLELAIRLSLSGPDHRAAIQFDVEAHQGVDKVGEGSTFFLNKIRDMPPSANENTVTFLQVVDPVISAAHSLSRTLTPLRRTGWRARSSLPSP